MGRGSSLSAVSRGGGGGATFFGFGVAAAWAEGTGEAVGGAEALGAESVPAAGGVAAWGMKGLASPEVEAGAVAEAGGGAEDDVAAGGFAGICAGGAIDGEGDVVTAGGVVAV